METEKLISQAVNEVEDYAFILLNTDGIIQSWNRGAQIIQGFRQEEVVGNHMRIFYTAEDQQSKLPEALLQIAIEKGHISHDGWRLGKGQKKFWASDTISCIRDASNKPAGFVKIVRDQSAGKKAEDRFRLVVESAPNAMLLVNIEGKITLVNHQAEKLFGYDRYEMIDRPIEMLMPMRFKDHHPDYRNAFLASPRVRSIGVGRELFARRKNGTEIPVEISLNPMETPEGLMVLAAIIDITERKKEEERFRMVVESAPNAIILINKDGKITLVNGATEKLFGYTREELLGKEVEALIPKRFRAQHPRFRTDFFSSPKARPMGAGRDLYAMRKDETEFPVEIGLNPIELADGDMVLASIIDISPRKILEANRLKSDFLANMSHELRTPLNAILGFSELLIDKKVGDLNARQIEYLTDVHASGTHLLQLINNVLDLAKIESGKTELSIENFHIREVIEGVINVFKPIASKKNVIVSCEVAPAVDVVKIDKAKFRQIMYNLISNAIKFNHDGGHVKISVERQQNYFILSVIDTGIGISKENIKKLFIPFVQVDSGPARQHEGSGLGLALTRNIVELHHGEIGMESTLGTGTTFWARIPINYDVK